MSETNNQKAKQYLCKYVNKQKLCTSEFRNSVEMCMKIHFLIAFKFRDCKPKHVSFYETITKFKSSKFCNSLKSFQN